VVRGESPLGMDSTSPWTPAGCRRGRRRRTGRPRSAHAAMLVQEYGDARSLEAAPRRLWLVPWSGAAPETTTIRGLELTAPQLHRLLIKSILQGFNCKIKLHYRSDTFSGSQGVHDCILPRFGCSISTMVFLGVAVRFYYFLLESLLCKLNVFVAFHE
jgi:hypothetical protein